MCPLIETSVLLRARLVVLGKGEWDIVRAGAEGGGGEGEVVKEEGRRVGYIVDLYCIGHPSTGV